MCEGYVVDRMEDACDCDLGACALPYTRSCRRCGHMIKPRLNKPATKENLPNEGDRL